MGPVTSLPHVDEHATDVEAGVDDVWTALLAVLDRTFARGRDAAVARVLGCADPVATGPRPLAVGSAVPGFHVVAAVPGRELALAGSHRFSSYALVFRLDPLAQGRTRLRAETRADFPGRSGGLYRLLVIGSGGHVLAVRRLLAGVQRAAQGAR